MNYTVGDSKVTAKSAAELIGKMHKLSRAPADSDEAWMVQVAYRMKLQGGQEIRTDTAAHFVRDMIDAGEIEEN